MLRTTIYLVRHGQTAWNVEKRIQGKLPVPLNETGKQQARKLGELFRCIPLDSVHSSPMHRTMETAKEIFAAPVECPQFGERDIGSLEGLSGEELRKHIPDVEQQWARDKIDWRPPGGGETVREFQERCNSAFKNIVKDNLGKSLLIVTHGGVIHSIIHWLHGGKPEEFFHVHSPENAEAVKITYEGEKHSVEHKKVNDRDWKKHVYERLDKPLF